MWRHAGCISVLTSRVSVHDRHRDFFKLTFPVVRDGKTSLGGSSLFHASEVGKLKTELTLMRPKGSKWKSARSDSTSFEEQ
jgi:hypothetical protein